MSEDRKAAKRKEFREKLNRLRASIDLLPEEQRSGYQQLVDGAEAQCRKLEENLDVVHETIADLRLFAKAAQFNIEASCREVEAARRRTES